MLCLFSPSHNNTHLLPITPPPFFFQDPNIIFVCGNNGKFFFNTPRLFNNTLEIIDTVRMIFESILFEKFYKNSKLSNDHILIYDSLSFFFQPNVNNIQGSIQSSLIQCVFSIPIEDKILNFLRYVNGSNLNVSNIANSYIPIFLDILKGSTNGEFDHISNTLQVVIGYVVNAERNIFHTKICNTITVGSTYLKTLKIWH